MYGYTGARKERLMKTTLSSSWLAPALLIALCVVPVVGGAVRLATVEMGAEVIPGNDRFLAAPLPVTVHILSVSVFCILGTFQVSGPIRRRNPAWHRRAGRVLVPFGIAAALSGLWAHVRVSAGRPGRPGTVCVAPVLRLGDDRISRARFGGDPPAQHRCAPCLDGPRLCRGAGGGHAGADAYSPVVAARSSQ